VNFVSDAEFYEAVDHDALPLAADVVKRYAERWEYSPHCDLMNRIKAFSMLHQETLLLMHLFARRCGGDVLEFGPYMGGSTVAMALGLKEAGRGRVVTIEVGGAYDHRQLPSLDIIADLEANLRAFDVRDRVEIVVGWSGETSTRSRVRKLLRPRSVGLMSMDADAFPAAHFWPYERYFKDGCLQVFDDIVVDGDNVKQAPVAEFVDRSKGRGLLEEFAVVRWGTWMGRYLRPPRAISRLLYAARDLDGLSPLIGTDRFGWRPITRAIVLAIAGRNPRDR